MGKDEGTITRGVILLVDVMDHLHDSLEKSEPCLIEWLDLGSAARSQTATSFELGFGGHVISVCLGKDNGFFDDVLDADWWDGVVIRIFIK